MPAVNGLFTQYNGMHVTEDGMLLLKGWAMSVALGPFMLAALIALITGTSWREFIRPRRTGHLLVVDPDTLAVTQKLSTPERCAYARTALVPSDPQSEMEGANRTNADEWLIMPGDEHIMRWRYRHGSLSYDPHMDRAVSTLGRRKLPGHRTGGLPPDRLLHGQHLPRRSEEGLSAVQEGARHERSADRSRLVGRRSRFHVLFGRRVAENRVTSSYGTPTRDFSRREA